MTENTDFTRVVAENWEKSMNVLNRLFEIARPSAVFGEPIQKGEYTVITASEVSLGMGLGTGAGSGTEEAEKENATPESGSGGGGGGGGGGWSRPVAVIISAVYKNFFCTRMELRKRAASTWRV